MSHSTIFSRICNEWVNITRHWIVVCDLIIEGYTSLKMANLNNVNMVLAIGNLEAQEDAVRNRRRYYKRYDPFLLDDRAFMKIFRLSKELVTTLIDLIAPFMKHQTRASDLSVKTKVLVALHFFATGSYQLPVGMNLHMAVSQSSVSRSISEVTDALNSPEIFHEWVRFPRNMEELNKVRQKFYDTFEMPGVIGCIDCTHVAIFPPRGEDPIHPEYIFINRKGYHSINTQLICDSSLKILHVNARFPGSCHDSHIWNSSNVEPFLRNLYNGGNRGYFLLGDSGYALRPWLLTPLQNPQGNIEEIYNRKHKSTRATIERCNGLLKMRFRCLLKHRVLHYSPEKASKIINACVVLHNICIVNNLEFIIDDDNEDNLDFGIIDMEPIDENVGRINPDLILGRRTQRNVINYFA